jgi:UDP-2-acetamido-3-amino-2,3-dideoxy-glucuronate N-acetyltransferase
VCGNEIGEYAFIGAGAVVTKDVQPYALIVGNPGRHVGWMSEHGHRLHFDEQGISTCPEGHDRYQLGEDGKVKKLGR